MQSNEQRLRFRDAMASLSAAVNIITTEGDAGRCGITATAVCPVTDTPPSLMVCINANSAMNPVFQGNGKLCVNVLNHEPYRGEQLHQRGSEHSVPGGGVQHHLLRHQNLDESA